MIAGGIKNKIGENWLVTLYSSLESTKRTDSLVYIVTHDQTDKHIMSFVTAIPDICKSYSPIKEYVKKSSLKNSEIKILMNVS